jgi:type IV pilus assembly protein PilV
MRTQRSSQQGVMLLEALIGILIFSLGVLALVAMQAVSISNVSNARYRTEAAFLANEIIGQMWMDRGTNLANVDTYAYSGGGASGALGGWVAKVNLLMPKAATYPPSIQINNVAVAAGMPPAREVIVTVRWRAPDAITTSSHVAYGYVSDP